MSKRTAQNSVLPPVTYELVDTYSYGDTRYELRKVRDQLGIYLYSNRTKDWTVYSKTEAEKKWNKLTDESNY